MAEYDATDVFRYEAPVLLFDSPGWSGSQQFGEPFDVEPGDERFIVAVVAGSAGGDTPAGPPFVLVNNFSEVLNSLVPEQATSPAAPAPSSRARPMRR